MKTGGPSRPAPSSRRRALRALFVAAGAAALVWLFRAVGWPAIEANLRAIGGWFAAIAALYAVAQAGFFFGWWAVMDPRPPLARLPRLFGVYLAGDAANYVSPGGVAGEPLKVHLLSGEVPTASAIASVTLHKHVDMLAQWLFVLWGVAMTLASFPLSRAARAGALAGVAGFGLLLAALTWALRRGTYAPAVRLLSRWRALAERLMPHGGSAQALDESIRRFYRERRGRFAAGVAFCFVGWVGGAVETYIVLRLLAPGARWGAALGIEALSLVLTTMLLFIPLRLGGAEGARAGVCVLLGLTAAQGVASGLVRRAREIVWALPGFAVILVDSWRGRSGRSPARRMRPLANGEAQP